MVKYWFEFLFHIIYYMTITLLKGINKEGNLFNDDMDIVSE